jgi:hypothetical protein
MVVWLAFVVSAVALVVSVASAVYARRQAVAAEDANWSASPPEFEVSVENPNSGAAKLVIEYRGGGALDQVDIELLDSEAGPLVGFGIGTTEGTGWSVGAARVGQSWTRPVVQRLSDLGSDGPPYRSGNVRLRVSCRHDRHQRDLLLDVKLPDQPWVY